MNCRSNIVNQQRPSSVDALSDEDIYSLIELAHASKSVVVNTAAQQWCMPPTVWHITYDAVVKRCDLAELPSCHMYRRKPLSRYRKFAGFYSLVCNSLRRISGDWFKLGGWYRGLHICFNC